jgi:hypothetical protein
MAVYMSTSRTDPVKRVCGGGGGGGGTPSVRLMYIPKQWVIPAMD